LSKPLTHAVGTAIRSAFLQRQATHDLHEAQVVANTETYPTERCIGDAKPKIALA
jgi:hypothetical protein